MVFNMIKKTKKILCVLICMCMFFSVFPLYASSAVSESYDNLWLWPVPLSFKINALDNDPSGKVNYNGKSLDIDANGYTGTQRLDVVSATSGTVYYICDIYTEDGNKGAGWGNYVVVKTADFYIVYAHLQSVSARYGEIKAGDTIGKMGKTGNASSVHLHMQAYNNPDNVNACNFMIFDKYIWNPLYIQKFSFANGLNANSTKYARHISRYYTTLSSSYYTFTSGYIGTFKPFNIYANIVSVRVKGARIYSQPDVSSEIVQTVKMGDKITVYGYIYDHNGNIWYLADSVGEEKWVPESDVGFDSYNFKTECTDVSSPAGTYDSYYDITFNGKIKSKNIIKTIKAQILSDKGEVSSTEIDVNSGTYDINDSFFELLKPNGVLQNGNYTYKITVTEEAHFPNCKVMEMTAVVYSTSFKINATSVDSIPPTIDSFKTELVSSTQLKFSCIAYDNKPMNKVTYTVSREDGSFSKTFESVLKNGRYLCDINVSSLKGVGKYLVTATAYDGQNNTAESVTAVYVPTVPKGETWVIDVDSKLSIRTGPGTTYARNGYIYNGEEIVFTEIIEGSSYDWGHFDRGWCALSYANFKSGYLYTISLNPNGGVGGTQGIAGKRFGVNYVFPKSVPEKEGAVFLGWSADPNSTNPEYKVGSSYSLNKSIVLYAIYDDVADSVSYREVGNYLIVDAQRLTSSKFISILKLGGSGSTVSDSNGKNINGYVYTGCKLSIKNGSSIRNLTVVILGDVNGDGTVTSSDYGRIMDFSNGVSNINLTELLKHASDIDGDGEITSIDSYKAFLISKK